MSIATFCFPIRIPKVGGGGFRFLSAFKCYLRDHGFKVTESVLERYEVLFLNSWQTSSVMLLAALLRNPVARVVHRIDGSAQDYGRDSQSDRIQAQVNRVADVTIFQSAYCRFSTREKFKVIGGDGPIIHNPVDLDTFLPVGQRRDLPEGVRIASCTWSTNAMKGSSDIYEVARLNPNVQFILCGRYPDAPELPNLHRLGVLSTKELAATYRSCHAFLTFARNEACPNVVLEALASGLPVLYYPSGSAPEVVGECGLPVQIKNFRQQLKRIMDDRLELACAARERAETLFNPDYVFERYLDVILTAKIRTQRFPSALRVLSLIGTG